MGNLTTQGLKHAGRFFRVLFRETPGPIYSKEKSVVLALAN